MAASSNLFRRHRNRDVEDPAPSSSSGGGNNRGGGNGSLPTENDGASERRDGSSNNNEASNTLSNTNDNDAFNNESMDDDDDVQEIVVQIPSGHPDNSNTQASPFVLPTVAWEPSEEATALRREAIHREVERVQRANFIHFLVLCLVPTTLLVIVIAAIVSEDGECSTGENALTVCAREPRSFVNAFTSRCICDAVKSVAGLSDGLGNEERDENSLWAPP